MSLRDVKRCLALVKFFVFANVPAQSAKPKAQVMADAALAPPLVLALAHCYFFRLPTSDMRRTLWLRLRSALLAARAGDDNRLPGPFLDLLKEGKFDEVVGTAKRRFCSKFALEPGVALNEALMENVYVVVVSILNLLPVFVIGKPGSSKTLAMTVKTPTQRVIELGGVSARAFIRF